MEAARKLREQLEAKRRKALAPEPPLRGIFGDVPDRAKARKKGGGPC